MSFEEYLKNKKINFEAFQSDAPTKYEEMKIIFVQIHPESFTAQKKFLLNNLRRKYPLIDS
ncbi:MAG: hypothetical protein MUE85_12895 [Microscillaceae bacterium]|jgi:hypothetical protein|nr:hypothetical protein [Microscillaceae bacterium]